MLRAVVEDSSPAIEMVLTNNGVPLDLTSKTMVFLWTDSAGTTRQRTCSTVGVASQGRVRCQFSPGDLPTPGTASGQFIWSDGTNEVPTTERFPFVIIPRKVAT